MWRLVLIVWWLPRLVVGTDQKSPLESWLWNLSVAIPQVSGSVDGFELELKDTVCTHFAIERIRGESESEVNNANLTVQIKGVKAKCVGKWKYEAENSIHRPKASGTMLAESTNSSAAALLNLIGMNGWPQKASLVDCKTKIDLDLSFGGDSISAKILKYLENWISQQIQNALNAELCDQVLEPLVSKNLTFALQRIDDGISVCNTKCDMADARRITALTNLWNHYPSGEFVDWSTLINTPIISNLFTCSIDALTPLYLTGLDLEFMAPVPGYGNITFGLEEVNASLSEFTKAQLSGTNASIDTVLSLKGWSNLSLGLTVGVHTVDASYFTEHFILTFSALDADLSAGIEAAIRKAMLGSDLLGQLASNPLGCLADATALLNATYFKCIATQYFMKISAPVADTSLEAGLDQVASEAINLMLDSFPALVNTGLRCLLDGVALSKLNQILILAVNSAADCVNTAPAQGLVHWNESAFLTLLDSTVTTKTIDWALSCLSTKDDPLYFSDLHVLEGLSATTLASTGTIPSPRILIKIRNTLASLMLEDLSWNFQFELPFDAYTWYQNTTLFEFLNSLRRLDKDTQAVSTFDTFVGSGKYFFRKLQNNCGPLEKALISPPILDVFNINVSSFAWNVSGWLGGDDTAMAALLDEAVIAISELAAEYGQAVLFQLNEGLRQAFYDTKEICANPNSSSSSKSHDTLITAKQMLLVIAISVIILTTMVLCIIFGRAIQRGTKLDQSIQEQQDNTLDAPLLDCAENLLALESRSKNTNLFFSPHVPVWLRYGVPLLLCANASLFIWSNSTSAASVDVELTLLEHADGVGPLSYSLGSLFKFSLSNSVRDMWKAGVYPLSVLIALCSGGWPYAKLIAMFVCWFAPPLPKRELDKNEDVCGCVLGLRPPYFGIDAETREATLIWLDALGKWSLVDSYVMTLMIVAFHFDVTVGMDEGGGDFKDAVIVHVYVEALTSMYVFVAATCLSLLLGHVVLACHRRDAKCRDDDRFLLSVWRAKNGQVDAENDLLSFEEEPVACCSLSGHSFDAGVLPMLCTSNSKNKSKTNEDVPTANDCTDDNDLEERSRSLSIASSIKGQSPRCALGFCTRLTIVLGLFLTLILIIAGAVTEAFDFDIRGLAGWIMGSGAKKTLSMVSLGLRVPRSSRHPHSPGAIALAVIYLAYALIFPLLLLPALLMLWLVPLGLGAQTLLFRICEVLNAWAALDVFMIAILASITEISQFAAFMVGDKCDSINKVLKKHFDEQLHGDDVCFTVVTQLKRGIWFLLAAALLSGFIAHLVLRCCHLAVHERDRRQRRYELRCDDDQRGSRIADDEALMSLSPRRSNTASLSSSVCPVTNHGRLASSSEGQS